jgi:ferredoxin-type protein NapH
MKTMPLRIRVKAVITTLALILFPVYYYYLSPVIPLMGSTQGIVTGSILVFIMLLAISMVLGRGFCSYLCPAGKIQDMTTMGSNRKFPRTYFSWLKYIVWASWLGTLFFLFRRTGGIKGLRFAFHTQMGISVNDIASLLTYLMVLLVFFIMALLFGRRAACHTLCWMAPFMILGKKLGKIMHIPSLTIKTVQTNSCVSCGRCDDVCPMSLEVSKMVKKGSIESVDCILCGNCVDTCGRHALVHAWRH